MEALGDGEPLGIGRPFILAMLGERLRVNKRRRNVGIKKS